MTPNTAATPGLNRALPGWATDAIRFGIRERDARDQRKVWTECMKIAMSAHRRGWTETEYLTEVRLGTNGLWRQLATRPGGRSRPETAAYKALRSAWTTGLANANDVGIRTAAEIASDATELAYQWADRITDGTDGLDDTEAAVLGYVVSETERRGYLRVTCPGRQVAEAVNIPHRTAARVLARLTKRGLLIKHSPGRRGTGRNRKAAIYGLVDPETLVT